MTDNASLLELMAASPKFAEVLRDLKRLEKYMTEAEKANVVTLVKAAMACGDQPNSTDLLSCEYCGDFCDALFESDNLDSMSVCADCRDGKIPELPESAIPESVELCPDGHQLTRCPESGRRTYCGECDTCADCDAEERGLRIWRDLSPLYAEVTKEK